MSTPVVDGSLHVASRRIAEGPSAVVREPWSGDELGRVVLADETLADEAAAAAVGAMDRLRALAAYERKAILRGVAREIEMRAEAFADLIAREAGKPIAMAKAEVQRGIATFQLGAEEATRMTGEVVPLDGVPSGRGYTGTWVRVPAGPVIALSPFNFPLNLVAHKIAPALAAGCSVVLKPPPQAPLTSLLLAECIRRAGAPDDAVQVLPCEVAVAERLVRDDRFATLSFTGSARVGWHLKAISGKKRVLLELGGNAAVLVHDDAAHEEAAARIVAGAFGYAGQVCIKVQRLYLHRAIAEAFVSRIVEKTRQIAPRSPLDGAALCGPMIDEDNAKRVEQWVEEAVTRRRDACSVAAVARAIGCGRRSWNSTGPARGRRSSTKRCSARC